MISLPPSSFFGLPLAAPFAIALAIGMLSQDGEPEPSPKPDPTTCTVCYSDPPLMKRSGVVSHGGFTFAHSDTDLVERIFKDELPIHWVESEHFKLGFAEVVFRDVSGAAAPAGSWANGALAMRPFARAHEYVERCEALYDDFLELVDLDDAVFPALDEHGDPILTPDAPYAGKGPHLGMAGKFEVLFLPGAEELDRFALHANGLMRATHNRAKIDRTDAFHLTLHLNDGLMWDDRAVYSNLAHGLAHNFLRGLEHDDYPIPTWFEVGLAHHLERELSHVANSFCLNPEAFQEGYSLGDWNGATRDLLRGQKAPYLEPLALKEHETEFAFEEHLIAWSMTRFLIHEHPEAYAGMLKHMKGLTDGKVDIGIVELRTAHQDAFAKHLDMTYSEFDKAWSKWAKKQR